MLNPLMLLFPFALPATIFAWLFTFLDWLGPIPYVQNVIDLYYAIMESVVVFVAQIIYMILTFTV